MQNGTELPARGAGVLFNVAILREMCLVAIGSWIHTRGPNNGFRPREFVDGLVVSVLEQTLSQCKEVR